jgi:hypothetical protein
MGAGQRSSGRTILSKLNDIESQVRSQPSCYAVSHFTGTIFSNVLRGLLQTKFTEHVGQAKFQELLDLMERDAGVGYMFGNKINARALALGGVSWSIERLTRSAASEVHRDPARFLGRDGLDGRNGVKLSFYLSAAVQLYAKTRKIVFCGSRCGSTGPAVET